MSKHWRRGALAVLVAVAVLVPGASGLAAGTKASGVPAKLVGTWTRKVTSADMKREGVTDIAAGLAWTLTIKKSGAASLAGIRFWTGPVRPAGANRIHINVGFAYPNVYKWRVLTLTKISEFVPTRAAVLQGVWKRK
jgi:hypothetical protein